MKIKTNLHFHTKDDVEDKERAALVAKHSLFEGLRKAKELGFDALAVTCHNFVTDDEKYHEYAKSLGINLIQGIEKSVEGKDVIMLNVDKSAENVETFSDLKKYKEAHPEVLIIAPHPFFGGGVSLGRKLKEHVELFDAVEYSWFHFKFLNLNKEAGHFALTHNLPIVATSDTHDLDWLDGSYSILEADDSSFPSIAKAVKEGKIKIISPPARLTDEYVMRILLKTTLNLFR